MGAENQGVSKAKPQLRRLTPTIQAIARYPYQPRAAVEVTKPATNVLVDFVDEGLFRAVAITTGAAGPGTASASEAGAAVGTAAPTAQQVASVNTANSTVVQRVPSATLK